MHSHLCRTATDSVSSRAHRQSSSGELHTATPRCSQPRERTSERNTSGMASKIALPRDDPALECTKFSAPSARLDSRLSSCCSCR